MNIEQRIQAILDRRFPGTAIRAPQMQVVRHALLDRRVLALMPTGYGKTLCYQLMGELAGGITIVVSPLISLMDDQVRRMGAAGYRAIALHSDAPLADAFNTRQMLAQGAFSFVYVSPERFVNADFFSLLVQLRPRCIVLDEAHCLSLWGRDFRPSFLKIPKVCGALESHLGAKVIRAAFTATATPTVQQDIVEAFVGRECPVVKLASVRTNITINVATVLTKLTPLLRILEGHQSERGIIYCSSVVAVKSLHQQLATMGHRCAAYHGKLSRQQKQDALSAFHDRSIDFIVATNAFGMGVDIPDIRFVIHWHTPSSIENYCQEIGRAGRDGLPASAYLLSSEEDRTLHAHLMDALYPSHAHVASVQMLLVALTADGFVSLTPTELALMCPDVLSPAQIRACIGVLERMGKILVLQDPEGALLIEDVALTEPLDPLQYQSRRGRLDAMVRQMFRYVTSRDCRLATLARYFNEEAPTSTCVCDRCRKATALPAIIPDPQPIARGRFGGPSELARFAFARDRIAAAEGCIPENVFDTATLQRLALSRPESVMELLEAGVPETIAYAHAVALLSE